MGNWVARRGASRAGLGLEQGRSESAGHSRTGVWACVHSGAAGGGALLQGSALTVPESLQGDGNCFASSQAVTPGALWACSVRPPRQAAGRTVLGEA